MKIWLKGLIYGALFGLILSVISTYIFIGCMNGNEDFGKIFCIPFGAGPILLGIMGIISVDTINQLNPIFIFVTNLILMVLNWGVIGLIIGFLIGKFKKYRD